MPFLVRPSFLRIWLRCLFTVWGEELERPAISLVVNPDFIILQIYISLGVRLSFFSVRLRPNEETSDLKLFSRRTA